jgi:hypothetical protein
VSEDFLDHHPNPYIRVFETLASNPHSRGPIQCPIAQEVGADLQSMCQGLAALKIDPAIGQIMKPADALATLQVREAEHWADYLAQQARRAAN